MDEFLARRLRSVAHNRAQWWVATVDNEVVASLGRHPLQFRFRGRTVPGFGICAVHTAPAQRRKGFAESLCREVIAASQSGGDALSLLFSDIAPAYYAKLGFREFPAITYRCERLIELAGGGPALRATRIDPAERIGLLAELYDAAHKDEEIYLARDRAYWEYTIVRHSQSTFMRLDGSDGGAIGYGRLGPVVEGDCSLELCLRTGENERKSTQAAAYRAAAAVALDQGAKSISGWLRPSLIAAELFISTVRDREIPMVRPLTDNVDWNAATPPRCQFWQTDHF